jgi:F-type H+-transporting ATPase subunit a
MVRKTVKSILVAAFSLYSIFIYNISFAQEPATENPQQPAGLNKGENYEGKEEFDANEVIFGHVLDAHQFHFLTYKNSSGEHHLSIPLPIILYSPQKGFSVFMASEFHHGEKEVAGYRIEGEKIAAVDPTVKVYDLSPTRNVVQMILSLGLLTFLMVGIAKKYKKGIGVKSAPTGWQNAIEPIITFVRDEVAKPNLGDKWEKFMPFLLTVFFFILINAIIGLIPGTANVAGNIAFTAVLGIISFVLILFNSNKHYWSHIFNPPVPGGVKPIMVLVEVMSIFTKPFALIIRLFANMLAGHIVIICLISLIFIFGAINKWIGWGFSPLSIGFSVFIYFIEILVAFLQAYIFIMLTAVFVGQAFEDGHHEEHKQDDAAIV